MPEIAENLNEQEFIQEALANFSALIEDSDCSGYLEMMNVGRFQFLKRKQMRVEINALRMALWRLALAKSFPGHADLMFTEFLDHYARSHPDKNSQLTVKRARQYWGMLEPSGDSDFNQVARHLASFQEQEKVETTRALTLRLALTIRSNYKFIFDRLI